MRSDLKNNLPTWYKDEESYYDLVLSDDMDSLVACSILREYMPLWSYGYYYDFDHLYKLRHELDIFDVNLKKVWVDVARLDNEMGFDNHLLLNRNYNAINPNNIAPFGDFGRLYGAKYAGSTTLTVWSVYDVPLPKTEEGKMLLLAIDSSFLGYYTTRFKDACCYYIGYILGFEELLDVLGRHTKKEFERLQEKYKLKHKFEIVDGHIKTFSNLDKISELLGVKVCGLEGYSVEKIKDFETIDVVLDIEGFSTMMHSQIDESMYTAAITFSKKLRYSKEII